VVILLIDDLGYGDLGCFGCADGWVYCLDAVTGELAWRFRAAPNNQQIVSYGKLKSVWPVPGNVLVVDGAAYFVAGRSSYMDGGIFL
jgi:outer membrane protein assembly factor BamB